MTNDRNAESDHARRPRDRDDARLRRPAPAWSSRPAPGPSCSSGGCSARRGWSMAVCEIDLRSAAAYRYVWRTTRTAARWGWAASTARSCRPSGSSPPRSSTSPGTRARPGHDRPRRADGKTTVTHDDALRVAARPATRCSSPAWRAAWPRATTGWRRCWRRWGEASSARPDPRTGLPDPWVERSAPRSGLPAPWVHRSAPKVRPPARGSGDLPRGSDHLPHEVRLFDPRVRSFDPRGRSFDPRGRSFAPRGRVLKVCWRSGGVFQGLQS